MSNGGDLMTLHHVRGGGLVRQVHGVQLMKLMREMMMMMMCSLEPLPTTKKASVVEHVFRGRVQRPVVALACMSQQSLTNSSIRLSPFRQCVRIGTSFQFYPRDAG